MLIGCYWQSKGLESSLAIECFDESKHEWLGLVYPATSVVVRGFSSVDKPVPSDKQMIKDALKTIIDAVPQHQVSAIHEKTWSRETSSGRFACRRGQRAATKLTRIVKEAIQEFASNNGIECIPVEDIPTNKTGTRRGAGNYLDATNYLLDQYCGTENRASRLALSVALGLAHNKTELNTVGKRLIKAWLKRTAGRVVPSEVKAELQKVINHL